MKIVFRLFLISFFVTLTFIIYLSTAGIETSKFNNQIGSVIKNLNKDLEIELQKVKIILDPLNFEINAKTVGPKIKIKDKIIELESIKTQIIINSFFNDNFSLKNLNISTRSLQIENFISFTRSLENTPELYILEKIIKKGFLIGDLTLEFDKKGNLKDNYKINGFVKNAQVKFLKKYNLDKINFIFNFEKNKIEFNDLNFYFNNTLLSSQKINVKHYKEKFSIDGVIQNNNLKLNNNLFVDVLKNYFPRLDFIDLNLNSKNKFSFRVDKKFKIDQLNLSSEINILQLKLRNNMKLKNFFPNIQNEIDLNDHLIYLDYSKENLSIKGKGKILLQKKEDQVNYTFLKKKKNIDFETNFIIGKNPVRIDYLTYKKDIGAKAEIKLNGSYNPKKKIIIKSFFYTEQKNRFKIKQLSLNQDLTINSIDEINLDYFDQDLRENKLRIRKSKNNIYEVIGSKFNASNLIKNFTESKKNDANILGKNIDLNIKLDQVFLDKENVIKNLNGNLIYKKNEIVNAEIDAIFSKKEKLKLTIKTNDSEKVTTLFLDQAEPIVRRFKFIKGFSGGSLDFYSSKKEKKTISNLKIYNFRLKELPILTKLLTLASLQGIADILSGEGITFDEFEMNFENQDKLMTISEMYAIGPAISILMEGYVEKNKLISLRGSLVPATTINKAIGTIPVLGKILVGSKTGEGVFGVSFKIKGPPGKLETSVNPIKTLTPRFITRTLEKIKKN